jgi:two-component system nitrate/nitrite response regulator NarL
MKRITTSDRVRVVVVDDSAEARAAIEYAVAQTSELELVASGESGEEALEIVARVDPDLILLDIRMRGLDGLETTGVLRARGVRACIVLVSALARLELPVGIETCGADATLPKGEVSPNRLSRLWHDLQRTPALQGGASLLVGSEPD